MPRESWTDERLDDLNAKVDRFDLRMEAGFRETREEFKALCEEIATQTRLMTQLFMTMMVGILGVLATVIVK